MCLTKALINLCSITSCSNVSEYFSAALGIIEFNLLAAAQTMLEGTGAYQTVFEEVNNK